MTEGLIGKRIKVLNDGYVELWDVMGSDKDVAEAAWLTSQADHKSTDVEVRQIIRYLLRHAHTTPFEMVEFKFKVRCPMDLWRQWIRHRMASTNEFSTRYSEAIDDNAITSPEEWRKQSDSNRQGSSGQFVTAFPTDYKPHWDGTVDIPPLDDLGRTTGFRTIYVAKTNEQWRAPTPGEYLSQREVELQAEARRVYEERLAFGVAKEQARKDLPLSTYTEAVWKIDLHNLLHFLSLRMDSHAQLEIRQYANVIGEEFVAKICPIAWEAFNDYNLRRSATLMTRLDLEAMSELFASDAGFLRTPGGAALAWVVVNGGAINKRNRERDEFVAKLLKAKLITEEEK